MQKIVFGLGMILMAFMSLACDCEDDFLDEFDADFVIEGKVIALEPENQDLDKVYITTSEGVFEVFTPNDIDLCGYPFIMGEDYIVFGYFNEDDNFFGAEGTYYTTLCTYTMSMEEWDSIMGE